MSELSDVFAAAQPWLDYIHLATDEGDGSSELDDLRSRVAAGASAIANNVEADVRSLRRLSLLGLLGAWVGLGCVLAAVVLIVTDRTTAALAVTVLAAIANIITAVISKPATSLRDDVLRTLPELRSTLGLLALLQFVRSMPPGPSRELANKRLIEGLLMESRGSGRRGVQDVD